MEAAQSMEDTLPGVTGANVQNPVVVENKQKAGHVLIHHQRTEERIAADWEKAVLLGNATTRAVQLMEATLTGINGPTAPFRAVKEDRLAVENATIPYHKMVGTTVLITLVHQCRLQNVIRKNVQWMEVTVSGESGVSVP